MEIVIPEAKLSRKLSWSDQIILDGVTMLSHPEYFLRLLMNDKPMLSQNIQSVISHLT